MPPRAGNKRATQSFAGSVRALRVARGLSLQALAERADVSKSMISKIERGDTQPSLDIAVRLAEALGSTVSEMLRHDEYARAIHLTKRDQVVVQDPKGRWQRRQLSPAFAGSSVEVLHAAVEPAATLGKFPAHRAGTEEYIVVLKGRLEIAIGGSKFALREGDTLFFEADRPHSLVNPLARRAEYLIVIKH